jgi:hypothetical protein
MATTKQPPKPPTALLVSRRLGEYGFKRDTGKGYGGFKVTEHRMGRDVSTRYVDVSWWESDDDAMRRLRRAGLSDFSQLTERSPLEEPMAEVYAYALGARWATETHGRYVTLTALPEAPKAARKRARADTVGEMLRAAGIRWVPRPDGYGSVSGVVTVQEADHVRTVVRPWKTVADDGFYEEELTEATGLVTAALEAAGYVFTRRDFIIGAIFEVRLSDQVKPA